MKNETNTGGNQTTLNIDAKSLAKASIGEAEFAKLISPLLTYTLDGPDISLHLEQLDDELMITAKLTTSSQVSEVQATATSISEALEKLIPQAILTASFMESGKTAYIN